MFVDSLREAPAPVKRDRKPHSRNHDTEACKLRIDRLFLPRVDFASRSRGICFFTPEKPLMLSERRAGLGKASAMWSEQGYRNSRDSLGVDTEFEDLNMSFSSISFSDLCPFRPCSSSARKEPIARYVERHLAQFSRGSASFPCCVAYHQLWRNCIQIYLKFPILCGWRMSRSLALLLHEENMALIRPSQPLESDPS